MAGWGLSATGISASGMAAERRRMEVISNNIANASSTRSSPLASVPRSRQRFSIRRTRST